MNTELRNAIDRICEDAGCGDTRYRHILSVVSTAIAEVRADAFVECVKMAAATGQAAYREGVAAGDEQKGASFKRIFDAFARDIQAFAARSKNDVADEFRTHSTASAIND